MFLASPTLLQLMVLMQSHMSLYTTRDNRVEFINYRYLLNSYLALIYEITSHNNLSTVVDRTKGYDEMLTAVSNQSITMEN